MQLKGTVKYMDIDCETVVWTGKDFELCLVVDNKVRSAFKEQGNKEFMFGSHHAREIRTIINNGVKNIDKCKKKDIGAIPFEKGVQQVYQYKRAKIEYTVCMFKGKLSSINIVGEDLDIDLVYVGDNNKIPKKIEYVQTRVIKEEEFNMDDGSVVQMPRIKTIEEIGMEKDITWVRDKKYYIVDGYALAEKIFAFLETYKGPIAYDTETHGLKINMFGRKGSRHRDELKKHNEKIADEIRRGIPEDERSGVHWEVDGLVGIVLCWKPNESYYIPVGHKFFKNIYEGDMDKPIVQALVQSLRTWSFRNRDKDTSKYVLGIKPGEEIPVDMLLMHRARNVLEKGHIVTHNGSFDWKVTYLYDIILNIKDDTMLLHQLLYKFKNMTGGRGERSALDFLIKKEFGVEMASLKDFFIDYKESKDKNKSNIINFSLMKKEGVEIYAPADGDFTLQLYLKYKSDLINNHSELEYIYNVEVIVACAMGYMEFNGHKIDEKKIESVRIRLQEECDEIYEKIIKIAKLEEGEELNLGSPAQMATLFYDKLKIPYTGEKYSVAKGIIKGYLNEKNDDGTDKYPVVHLYSKWKTNNTLITKFFGKLPDFMYPGGFIFPSYGQNSTATGRMSSSKPNAQQYPEVVAGIVVPRKNCVHIDSDYSQIEYRVLVKMANEPFFLDMFENPDNDYHTLQAANMFGVDYSSVTPEMRSDAKGFNFGIPYGMGFRSLAKLIYGKSDDHSVEQAKIKYEMYFKDQPNVRKFFEDVKEMALINKYTKTYFNRRRYYSFVDKDGNINQAIKAMALRQAGNAVIQGCLGGDTRIQTKEMGIVKIKDAVGRHLNVWDGDKWSGGDIVYSGKKKKCIVNFSNGQSIVCSNIHKFQVMSNRGNKRFVECKDLLSKENSKNPHRVIINKKYEQSDHRYSSEDAYKYKGTANNSNNVFLEDIKDSFDIGVVLGRLASDGSILPRDIGASSIIQYVAESEYSILPELKRCMDNLGFKEYSGKVREGRSEAMTRLSVYSKSLTSEVENLDIKHKLHDNIFKDTEVLRGFIRGIFDGDGGISGKTITLTFGKQYDFEPICKDIQKALLFFGIRSRYYGYTDRYKITIKTNDNQKFLDVIGFINENKQAKGRELECETDENMFGPCLIVESVDITDEEIDMYDVCNTEDGYYVADGVITHNTAADIFKIGVARVYMYIKKNNLFEKFFMTNMIHDEQLNEIDVTQLNAEAVVRDIGKLMQFRPDGFPPLFIGTGVELNWLKAKSSGAEIHPFLYKEICDRAGNTDIRDVKISEPGEVVKHFASINLEFRIRRVKEYVMNSDNYHKVVHPAIGSIINSFFSFGLPKAKKGEEKRRLKMCLRLFLEEYKIDVREDMFEFSDIEDDVKADGEYDDSGDEFDEFEIDYDDLKTQFSLIDEKDGLYGIPFEEVIDIFGLVVSNELGAIGIDTRNLTYGALDRLAEYIEEHKVDEKDIGNYDEKEIFQVMLLGNNKILKKLPYYVKDLGGSSVTAMLKMNSFNKNKEKVV